MPNHPIPLYLDEYNRYKKEKEREPILDIRRLLIRILTSQSEIYAAKAPVFRQTQEWQRGAEQYSAALQQIRAALFMADSEISKYMDQQLDDSDKNRQLCEDADVVEIAITSLATKQCQYLEAAKQQEAFLLQKLQPQWESRDRVKAGMGSDRWTRNPAPSRRFADMRTQAEKELRDIRNALSVLEQMDTNTVKQSIRMLKSQLLLQQQQIYGPPETTTTGTTSSSKKKRYNGVRPPFQDRVFSWHDYPDATTFGWTFTGSWNGTEFFEKANVMLDWYFTTATLKTSLNHPTQGKTQLFAAQVDPVMYRAILENPRIHTGNRYHTRST
jgi:hypothetical protein